MGSNCTLLSFTWKYKLTFNEFDKKANRVLNESTKKMITCSFNLINTKIGSAKIQIHINNYRLIILIMHIKKSNDIIANLITF